MMSGFPVRADGGFIWLIVGIFWVVAQIAGAAAKKAQPPKATGDTPASPPVDPFAELIRKLSDTQRFEVPQPEYEELPEEEAAPAVVPQNAWRKGEIEKLPDIEPLRRETMGQAEKVPAPADVPEIDIRPKMSAFRSSVPSIKLPAMNLSFQGSETSVRKVPNLGNILNASDKRSLRRAMLSHIIFSPPKAME